MLGLLKSGKKTSGFIYAKWKPLQASGVIIGDVDISNEWEDFEFTIDGNKIHINNRNEIQKLVWKEDIQEFVMLNGKLHLSDGLVLYIKNLTPILFTFDIKFKINNKVHLFIRFNMSTLS